MRILWFTNTPALGKEKLSTDNYGGGWMESLQEEFEKIDQIQLGISFLWDESIDPFSLRNTNYYPIHNKTSDNPLGRWINRLKHKLPDTSNIIGQMDRIISEFKPDLIHVWGTENPFGLISEKTTVPVLVWIQGVISVCILKYHIAITQNELYKYSNKKNLLKGYGIPHEYFNFKKLENQEHKVFGCNQYFAGRTLWDRRIKQIFAPQATYYHCDELLRKIFYNHLWKFTKTEEYTFVSVLSPQTFKGFETIIEICLLLIKTKQMKFRWKIIGTNFNDEIIKVLQKKYRIDYNKINVTFLGRLNAVDLISELLSSQIFIHPSHMENSPNSICEAMLIGMPIIATCVGGIPGILENEKEGILIHDEDAYAMSGAIIELVKDEKRQRFLSENARKRALKRHDPKSIMTDIINIYQNIIQGKKLKPAGD